MNIESTKKDKAVLIKVIGRMDAAAAPEFEKACEQWIKDGALQQIVDLEGLQYISSLGLSRILVVAKTLEEKGGSLVLCGLKGMVKEVFEITHFASLFPIYESVDEALAHV